MYNRHGSLFCETGRIPGVPHGFGPEGRWSCRRQPENATDPWSKSGITTDFTYCSLDLLVRQRRALQSAPIFSASVTCSSNRTCSSIVMPIYFAWETTGSEFPRNLTVMSWPEIRMTWLLLVFRIRFRSIFHWSFCERVFGEPSGYRSWHRCPRTGRDNAPVVASHRMWGLSSKSSASAVQSLYFPSST